MLKFIPLDERAHATTRQRSKMDKRRRSGVLMPISALPGKYGIGTLGKSAKDFIDYLHGAGVRVWQILPLSPTGYGDSPYQSCDSRALNYYFIDLDLLCKDGLLTIDDLKNVDFGEDDGRVDYYKLFLNKASVLKKAYARLDKRSGDWQAFLREKKYLDFGVFMALKEEFNYTPWTKWGDYSVFSQEKVDDFAKKHKKSVEFWIFTQYVFLKQWQELRAYASKKKVEIMGDIPIYISFDSVETWKYGDELFLLGKDGKPSLVAGVPPDAFSDDGQLWGNPVYDWQKMRLDGFKWWHDRIDYALSLFDIVRIDHFRGFDRFYAIPANETDAKGGSWLPAPGAELFMGKENCNIVAEDLGIIDDGVLEMMKKTGYPGMKVLEFSFDGSPYNPYKPTNYSENCVAYTGTHDNTPLYAFISEANEHERATIESDLAAQCKALGIDCNAQTFFEARQTSGICENNPASMANGICGNNSAIATNKADEQAVINLCKTVIKLLFSSKAFLAIIPMQDLLFKGAESRINSPSTLSTDNWSFRFSKSDFNKETAAKLKALLKSCGR